MGRSAVAVNQRQVRRKKGVSPMKKNPAKKLVLAKETLLNLDSLARVQGAAWSDAGECPSKARSDCAYCASDFCASAGCPQPNTYGCGSVTYRCPIYI